MSDKLSEFLKQAKEKKKEFYENKEQEEFGTNVNERVLLVDGTNLFIRSFSANPKLDHNGNHIGGTTGTLRTIAMLCERYRFTRVVMVFDGRGGSTRRKKVLPEYKSGRAFSQKLTRVPNMEESSPLAIRQNSLREMANFGQFAQLLPFQLMIFDNVEADDVIGYISSKIIPNEDTSEVMICTGDKDYFQLINDMTSLYYLPTKIVYNEDRLKDEYGSIPQNFIYYKAILGDESDGIKGIKGIGKKTLKDKFSHILMEKEIESVTEFFDIIQKELDILVDKKANKEKIDTRYANALKKILDNKSTIKTNYEVMDLRDSSFINGEVKSLSRKAYREYEPSFDFSTFKREFMNNGYYNGITSIDSWIHKSFSSLVGISAKK